MRASFLLPFLASSVYSLFDILDFLSVNDHFLRLRIKINLCLIYFVLFMRITCDYFQIYQWLLMFFFFSFQNFQHFMLVYYLLYRSLCFITLLFSPTLDVFQTFNNPRIIICYWRYVTRIQRFSKAVITALTILLNCYFYMSESLFKLKFHLLLWWR